MDNIENLLDNYYKTLRTKTFLSKAEGEWMLIETPFVGLFNDMICLYARTDGSQLELSDGGETLSNLEMSGVSLRAIRSHVMRRIANHGVELSREDGTDTLRIVCSIDDASERYHDMLSCLIYMNGLNVLAKSEPSVRFKAVVDEYFAAHNIGVIPSFSMKGETGLDYDFDFGISGRSESLLIKSFDVFTKPTVATFLLGVEDIRAELADKRNIRALAIINENKPINPSLVKLLEMRGTAYMRWSERDTGEALKRFQVA